MISQELPKGSEKGKFLSLDLGGTNFRVIFMELTKDKVKTFLVHIHNPRDFRSS